MRSVKHFDSFMASTVNLNTTRLELLESSIETLKGLIRDSDWGPKVKRFVPQGSWAHETIIKPVDGNPFDADLLAFVEPKDGWDAKKYVNELYRYFSDSKTYEDKVQRYSHCVTITYAGERKIDIAPCVIDRDSITRMEVCNRNTNTFELSEPEKYTDWLLERNKWTGKNGLSKVTRLVKYLRDTKGTFSCKSILLTTLLGARITALDAQNELDFSDLPTALKTIMGRLDDWLALYPTRPDILNPVLATEVLSDLLNDAQYANFSDKIHRYRTWIDEAYDEEDGEKSVEKWQRVFGEEFAPDATFAKAASVTDTAIAYIKPAGLAIADDLVALFHRHGMRALPPDFDRMPHQQLCRVELSA